MDERTITRALLGDREAQEAITARGELLPCQCGGEADCNCNALVQNGEFKWSVECLSCGLILGPFETEKEATGTWNHRPPLLTPTQMAVLERETGKFEEGVK